MAVNYGAPFTRGRIGRRIFLIGWLSGMGLREDGTIRPSVADRRLHGATPRFEGQLPGFSSQNQGGRQFGEDPPPTLTNQAGRYSWNQNLAEIFVHPRGTWE